MGAFFRHTAADTIYIQDGSNNMIHVSLAIFLIMEPSYLITDGATNPNLDYKFRQYTPSVSHIFITFEGDQYNGSVPWTNGDTYISRIEEYLNIVDNPTQDLTIEKNIKITTLSNYLSGKISTGGVSLFSTTMPSNTTYAAEAESYTRQSNVPSGYYLYDADGNQVTITLSQLQQYEDGLIQMRWAHSQVYDTHVSGINACSDIASVQAYDFTTGWPTLPFVPS